MIETNARIKDAIERFSKELEMRVNQQEENEKNIAKLTRVLSGLAAFIEDKREREEILRLVRRARRKPLLLSEAILQIMSQCRGQFLTAPQVLAKLRESEFDMSSHANELANVSMALTRLDGKGVRKKKVKGKVWYTFDTEMKKSGF